MRTPASILGHPIHPMLITIPVGLWIFSLACDLVYIYGTGEPIWRVVALYAMVGGIVGALAAAIPGIIDLLSLPPALKRTALIHMTINLFVVALYAMNAWMRNGMVAVTPVPVWDLPTVMSVVGVGLLVVSGWLGGKMVYEAGVGVSALEAPSSERR